MRTAFASWVVVVAACNPSGPPPKVPEGAPVDPHIESVERNLPPLVQVRGEGGRVALADRMRELKVPGFSLAVFENYELKWARAYGVKDAETGERMTPTTMLQAGSVSKSVNALAALLAVADGALSLDAPINEALTGWQLPENSLTRATPVTLRQLLSHTAGTTVHGFGGYEAGRPVPTLRQVLDGEPPANSPPVRVDLPPGARFRYSGGGTTIAQMALVDRLGKPYPAILEERVLAPLGMAHSTFEQPLSPERLKGAAAGHGADGRPIAGKRRTYPEMAAAGLWTTPSDLATFFIELARARANKSARISQAVAAQMTTGVTTSADPETPKFLGLGVFFTDRNGAKSFGHGGSDAGFQTQASVSMNGGRGLIMMANADSGHLLFPEVERAVFAAYGWPGADEVFARVSLGPSQRARLTGRFVSDLPFAIEPRGEGFELRRPFDEPFELVPIAQDEFIARKDGVRYKLAPDGSLELRRPGGGPTTLAARLPDSARLPVLELAAGREAVAVAAWQAISQADPKSPAVDEARLTQLGRGLLARGSAASAVTVFSFLTNVRPDSAAARGALGDAHAAAGDKARALAAYRAALEKLSQDRSLFKAARERLREHLEGRLQELR